MKILYIGDIMARPGIETIETVLPDLRKERQIDLVIAQAENVTNGRSMSLGDMKRLQTAGVDFFTGGNHTPKLDGLNPLLEDLSQPVIGPANMLGCPGRGWKYIETKHGKVLVISILATVIDKRVVTKNPLQTVDAILAENRDIERVATIVNIHGDYSSEKVIFGYYLDGKVSAVIGDHWHVPTADAMVLPRGTAHITDVGMTGILHSSLGIKLDAVIPRWRDGVVNRNEIEYDGPWQFNAVLIQTNAKGLASSIVSIQQTIER